MKIKEPFSEIKESLIFKKESLLSNPLNRAITKLLDFRFILGLGFSRNVLLYFVSLSPNNIRYGKNENHQTIMGGGGWRMFPRIFTRTACAQYA